MKIRNIAGFALIVAAIGLMLFGLCLDCSAVILGSVANFATAIILTDWDEVDKK